jgi:hypothetical protein
MSLSPCTRARAPNKNTHVRISMSKMRTRSPSRPPCGHNNKWGRKQSMSHLVCTCVLLNWISRKQSLINAWGLLWVPHGNHPQLPHPHQHPRTKTRRSEHLTGPYFRRHGGWDHCTGGLPNWRTQQIRTRKKIRARACSCVGGLPREAEVFDRPTELGYLCPSNDRG